jgi:uncharacterized protein YraI
MRVLIYLALAFFIVSASADNVAYSAFHIPPHETLKARAQPIADAPVVVEIPPNGTGIALTGTFGSGRWAKITYGGKTGWVDENQLGIGVPGKMQIPSHVRCTLGASDRSLVVKPAFVTLIGGRDFEVFQLASANLENETLTLRARSFETNAILTLFLQQSVDASFVATAVFPGQNRVNSTCRYNEPPLKTRVH